MNLIDHIGNFVTVWTKEGNSPENRLLITADEMGLVISPSETDPGQGKEIFIPWNRVKYVDLIKPAQDARPAYQLGDKSVIEHVPGVISEFAEIGDTIQITGNVQATVRDGVSSYWLFVGSVWEVTSIIDDWLVVTSSTMASYRIQRNGGGYKVIEKAVKQAKVEHAGDEVLLTYNQNGHRIHPNVQLLKIDPNKPIDEAEPLDVQTKQPETAQVGNTVKRQDGAEFVVRLRSDSIWSGVVGFDINGTGVEYSAQDGEYTIVARATDECEGEAPEPTTAELVEMLAKREGVSETSVDAHRAYSVSIGGDEFGGTGPARILVVTD